MPLALTVDKKHNIKQCDMMTDEESGDHEKWVIMSAHIMVVFCRSLFSNEQCSLSTLCWNNRKRWRHFVSNLFVLSKVFLLMTKDQMVTLWHLELRAAYCSMCASRSDSSTLKCWNNEQRFIYETQRCMLTWHDVPSFATGSDQFMKDMRTAANFRSHCTVKLIIL